MISSLDVTTSGRSRRLLQAQAKPALMGLVSAALLVGVVALYDWGTTISTDSSNVGNFATGWGYVLPLAAGLLALVVAVGLPIWWGYKKGLTHVIAALAYEGLILMVALLISGFFIFNGSTSSAPGGNTPVGCGCSSGAANYCIQCND